MEAEHPVVGAHGPREQGPLGPEVLPFEDDLWVELAPPLPWTLAPGGSERLWVTYRPLDLRDLSSVLSAETDAALQSTAPVRASVEPWETVTDTVNEQVCNTVNEQQCQVSFVPFMSMIEGFESLALQCIQGVLPFCCFTSSYWQTTNI